MIKKIAWDTFKNTGDINSFLEFKQIENIENNIEQNVQSKGWNKINGKYENERNNFI